jgi:hypothetical protein
MKPQWILRLFVAAYGAAALAGVAAVPPVTYAAYDHVNFHLPTIQAFARDLPAVDVVNYRSATTPGWHLAMALLYRAFDEAILPLRLIHVGLSLLLIAVLFRFVVRRLAPHMASP